MSETIEIDQRYLNTLRAAYAVALHVGKGPQDVIKIDGHEYVMQYLKYLIEYAEGRLGKVGP